MFFSTMTMYVIKYSIPVMLCLIFIISCWLLCVSSMLKRGSMFSTPKKSVLLLTLVCFFSIQIFETKKTFIENAENDHHQTRAVV